MVNKISFDRVVNFSDAVMAIVITILILELKVPSVDQGHLVDKLAHMSVEFLGFLISFVMIGIMWLQHHKLFRMVDRYNTGLLVLNFMFLLCVCFIPFPSGLIAKYQSSTAAIVMYYSTIGLASLCRFGMLVWCHATGILNITNTNYVEVRSGSVAIPLVCGLSIITAVLFGNLTATVVFIVSPIFIKIVVRHFRSTLDKL
jgi:uncharacterized membrane protein